MKALTWHGKRDVRVEDVPDPRIQESTDAVIKVTSTAICGSDLHLYDPLGPFLSKGDVLGHETMGIVEEVGADVTNIRPGDRVVIPFNISCGHCWMCERGLMSQCETTQVRSQGKGAALFGYTELYGSVPGGQAEYLRVPQAQFGPIPVPEGVPDERFLYLSDILPTAWQGVEYAAVPEGGSLAVFGLGPVGLLAVAIGVHRGLRVIGVDNVPERMARAEAYGATVVSSDGDPAAEIIQLTAGRGVDGTLDAVGMEAHGSPVAEAAIKGVGFVPDALAKPLMERAGIDRLAALRSSIAAVRRGGTVSVSGVYGGMADPMPMMEIFDKQLSLRFGQCNVKRWIDDIVPVVMEDGDPLGLESLATHRLPLADAPSAYSMFQKKEDGCIKVVLTP
ncbi:zinc-dependent alcohol dehydrogenase [Knoellia locipacati]|uniref:Glutathione-dependent formaldehyde dehydrogenase n=1 Tax=Knoellia locipacati TaxID=882824 RepID=A0A512SYN4_9MICO|nr:zinc-dependent alcohol dehydrogenase [Knoellia locipacati]GEQ13061.1 glutathione-dependent formaldehyde dehydrogenase [Knoellia locipacati]